MLRTILRSPPATYTRGWLHRANLEIDPAAFEGFSSELQPCMRNVAATRFFRYDEHLGPKRIPGWLTPKERQILYAAGKWLFDPITEIGSWVGLSTTAIARGIRDGKQKKQFLSYDLWLSEDQFRAMADGTIGMFLPGDDVSHGVCTEESYRKEILPALRSPGGSNGELKRHLAKRGLLDLVQTFVGDFHNFKPIPSGTPVLRLPT